MNVFLGIFVPESGKPPIWEKDFNFDYYLHHQVRIDIVIFKYKNNILQVTVKCIVDNITVTYALQNE